MMSGNSAMSLIYSRFLRQGSLGQDLAELKPAQRRTHSIPASGKSGSFVFFPFFPQYPVVSDTVMRLRMQGR